MQLHEQVDTGVDVGSNETAPARTSADAVRPGRLRGRCLAALVTFTALLTLPLQAEAQTTLVSNTGQTSDGTLGDSRDRAQAFTTGANSGGYTLSSVEIISADAEGDDTAVSVCTVDVNGFATSTCTALTAPSSFAAGTLEFTGNMTLAANTTYTLLLTNPGGETVALGITNSNGEDTGGATGWSIDNAYDIKDTSGVWGTTTSGRSFRIAVKGTVVGTTLSTDATLRNLGLKGATGNEPIALSPVFDSATETYTSAVANRIDAVTLTARKTDANATVAITNDGDTSTPSTAELNLTVGSNTMTVTVTAESGATKTYTITVTRASAPPAPTDCPAGTDWCTTMTVGYARVPATLTKSEQFGYLPMVNFGDLRSTTFSHHGTNYTVSQVYEFKNATLDGNTTLTDDLTINVSPALPDRTILQLGSLTFTVDTDSATNTPGQEQWNILANPLSWTAGQHVTVSLKLPEPTPALSIADASANENAGHLLFDVTLSRALRNTVKVDFETISGGTATEGVDYHARRTYTHVILEGDKTAQMGFALIEDTVAAAGETVKVRLSNARVVDAYGNKIKDLDITTAEATGTINAPTTTTTNVPGLTIRIKDATGDEDDGYLDFKVRLSKKYDDYVCYDFETISGGTAAEGMDYLKFPKATYWMQIGKRVDKPFVRIIDDRVNDNGETVKVKISNARLCNDPSQTLSITRAEATGTIRNSDPLPQALMARFGRTVAVHVVERVEERMAAPREAGFEAQFAGRQLRPGMGRELVRDFLSQLGASADRRGPGARGALSGSPMAAAAGSMGLGDGNLLTGSSFVFNRETRQGGMLSFWSRGARSSFAGREGPLGLDGDVRTTMVGADYAKGLMVVGLSLAHSRGQGGYHGLSSASSGHVASSVTGLYPWMGYTLSDRVSVWGVTGYGKGALTLTPGAGTALESGLSMAMAAGGLRGELADSVVAGFGLAFKADALWVGTATDGVEGPGGNLAATSAAVTRYRTALEASRGYRFQRGLSLQPSLEVGLRRDGGDAETGAGVDIAGGLIVSDALTGLSADVRVRMLLVHQDQEFRDRGVSLSFGYNPTPLTPFGFMAKLTPSWGGQATSGAQALWGQETMAGVAVGGPAAGGRLEAELGYGMPVGGRWVGMPSFGIGTSGHGRDYRLGYGLTVAQDGAMHFELGIDANRRESPSQGTAEHGVLGRLTARW